MVVGGSSLFVPAYIMQHVFEAEGDLGSTELGVTIRASGWLDLILFQVSKSGTKNQDGPN